MRALCIHGHFYQPPRENPWLGRVERQPEAAPYHNWNERITAECYRPNTAARLLDTDGRLVRVVNNFARMSFNIGPTLLAWLEEQAPDAYRAILDADRDGRTRFAGHGPAIAQAYNHMIMPLAPRRDKVTQVRWSVADFRHRFGRPPEGMWLPETAVDLETLEVLAAEGVRFTILAPHQARRIRPLAAGASAGEEGWVDVSGGGVDPTTAYRQQLPSGQAIVLFFYDGPIARAVAFEGLLNSGEEFTRRLRGGFVEGRPWAQLVHIATDGESYGHHHRFGEMALAYALLRAEEAAEERLTVYADFLERHPPLYEVEIAEHTSWSCPHGVERWRAHCGCATGAHPEWTQEWRAPLRAALDWLRDVLAAGYETAAAGLFTDPWAARDDAMAMWLDRSPGARDRFFARHAARALSAEEQARAGALLEIQRQAMLMFASDGWFFDDLSRLETRQLLRHAGRAIELAAEFLGASPEAGFRERLAGAQSNLPEAGDGARIYQETVAAARAAEADGG